MRQTTPETPVKVPSAPFWIGLAGALFFGMLASAAVSPSFITAEQAEILGRWAPLGLCLGLGVWAWASRHRHNQVLKGLRERIQTAVTGLLAEKESLEKRLAEHQLAAKDQLAHEQWLRLILEHSSDGIDITEKNLETHARRLVLCNDRFVEMSGYSREELEACPDLDQLTVDTAAPEVWDSYTRCIAEGRPYRGQSCWRRPDGKENYYEWTAAPFQIGDKHYVVSIDRDITERKHAEQALIAERNLLQTLVDTLPDNIFVKDLEGRFVFSNQACVRHQTMDSGETLMGKTDFDFVSEAQAREFWEQEQHVMRTGQPLLNQELIDPRDSERPLYFLSSKVPWRDHQGRILGVIGVNRDITERKHAENTLANERNLLRTLVDHLPETIFVKDREGRFLFANASCVRHQHVESLEQIIGKTDFDLMPLDRAQFHRNEEIELIRTGQSIVNQEICFLDLWGHTRWTLNTKVPWRDRGGNVIGIVGLNHEITERKLAEQTLVAERNLLQSLVDTLPDIIFVKDLEGRFVFSNQSCLLHQRVESSAALMGKTDFDFLGESRAREFWEQEQNIIRTGQPLLNQELTDLHDPEHPLYFLSSKTPWRDHQGRILGVIGVNRDITERKRVENALADERNLLRTLVDHLPQLVFVKDTESRFVFANVTCMRNLRVQSPEGIIGKTDFDLIPLQWARFHRDEEIEIIRTGRPIVDQELCLRDSQGRPRWTLNTKVPWRDHDGNIIGIVGLNHEITERKLAEERTKQHQEMMAHVARVSMAGEMAGGLAHELNQPLSAIVNYAHGCVRRLKSDPRGVPEIIAAIEQIIAQAERAAQIIRWLRDYVRRQKTRRSAVDLNQAVSEAIALVEHEARQRDILIHSKLAPGQLTVFGDLIQIEQVILNLVRNSFEAMHASAPDRRVLTIETGVNHDGRAEISVSDTGCGLESENLERLFDPFFTTKPGGMGLGLPISRSIIEEHGGRLGARPRPEGGAIFVVEFPVRQENNGSLDV